MLIATCIWYSILELKFILNFEIIILCWVLFSFLCRYIFWVDASLYWDLCQLQYVECLYHFYALFCAHCIYLSWILSSYILSMQCEYVWMTNGLMGCADLMVSDWLMQHIFNWPHMECIYYFISLNFAQLGNINTRAVVCIDNSFAWYICHQCDRCTLSCHVVCTSWHCDSVMLQDQLLFCDDCDRGYHMYCLSPPLSEPPEGKVFK